jgi:hypothetical protein
MRNLNNLDEDGNDHDYWPNELAELSRTNPQLYREIIESNLSEDDTVEEWQQRNLKRAQEDLAEQRKRK